MKYTFLFAFLLSLVSCAPKNFPLKGSYPDPPITQYSEKPFDSVWSNAIDYITKTGLAIKVIDKQSGIIVSDDYNMSDDFTHENKDQSLFNSKAFLVSSFYKNGNMYLYPDKITANLIFRIKPQSPGSSVGVAIVNIRPFDYYSFKYYSGYREGAYTLKSTGRFENAIIERIR